jgi:V8-like Glu-specific endopeptidase
MSVLRRLPTAGALVALTIGLLAYGEVPAQAHVATPPEPAADATQATASHSRLVPAEQTRAAAERASARWTPERLRSATPAVAPASAGRATSRPAPQRSTPGQIEPVAPKLSAQPITAASLVPLSGSVTTGQEWTSGGLPANSIGVAFFTDDTGAAKYCTATSLRSDSGNALLTAGHCVINAANGNWYNWNYQTGTWGDWIFIPGYRDGSEPFGRFYARQLWVIPEYVTSRGSDFYDTGAVVMNTNTAGAHLQDVVGAQGAQWNWPHDKDVTFFGYPQSGRAGYTGTRLIFCRGRTYTHNQLESLNCDQGHGASGGPWLARFDGSFGFADSVLTEINEPYMNGPVSIDGGPYFDDHFARLWNNVRYL